jgi:hypothetical protein
MAFSNGHPHPLDLSLARLELDRARKPAEFEEWAMRYGHRLIDRIRELERQHQRDAVELEFVKRSAEIEWGTIHGFMMRMIARGEGIAQ